MAKEMEPKSENSEPIEVIPEGIGSLTAAEAAPLLERASSRIQTLGWKGEFWDGVKENLKGAATWIKAEKAGIVKRSLSVVVGVSFLTTTISACSNGPGIVATPSETGPVATEVVPTATDAAPTDIPATPTEIVPTPTNTEAPKPAWQTTIETQDPEDQYFKTVDGTPEINLYNTSEAESIKLAPESIKSIETNDGLNPNILSAVDAEGNKYAFNPDHGWFALPEVQLDYNKLEQYTQVDQAFIEDGRANITTALLYAENPTISPDAIDPVYWISYYWADKTSQDKIPMLCDNACGLNGEAYQYYHEQWKKMYFNAENKPFAWTGFYKVKLGNGESVYVISRTLKNPSQTNPNQTINLFYGYDQKIWEDLANTTYADGETGLHGFFNSIDLGGIDLTIILPPPTSLNGASVPFQLSPNDWITGGNPVIAELQERGGLISKFDPVNLQIVTEVLQGTGQPGTGDYLAPLTQPLPAAFSTHILLTGHMSR
jgi:hypothetical protein